MSVYRRYDQDALDAQLNLRARHDDHETFFRQWADDSAAARAGLRCETDVAYAPGGAAWTLDAFRADAAGAPVMVFIHGGYWQFFGKGSFSFLAPPFVAAGFQFVSINYPLAPAVSMDEIVDACRAALAWTWRNAAALGADPARIHASGHSAGGHLTAMMATTDWPAYGADLPADLLKGALAISGLYELTPIQRSYMRDGVRLSDDQVARLSPIRLLPAPTIKVKVAVGEGESDEFLAQQAEFVARWTAAGRRIEVVAAPGRHHFNVLDDLACVDGPLFRAAADMMG